MRGRITGRQLIVAALVLIALVGTNIGQYAIWDNKFTDRVEMYTEQVTALKSTLANIGELVDIYTVRAETLPGKEVMQEDLVPVRIPSSFISDAYVLDPAMVVGKFYKIKVLPGTPLTSDLIMDVALDDTDREIDVVADTWTIGLKQGDYVDLEITYPMGEKFIVLSHKRISQINQSTVKLVLNGTERHLYSGVLVDYFLQLKKGAVMNMVKYVEPGAQKQASIYYAVPNNILAMILADPNIVTKVDSAINAQRRSIIDNGLTGVTDITGNLVASGRSVVTSKMTGASTEAAQKEKERLEKEAYDAIERAKKPPVTPTTAPKVQTPAATPGSKDTQGTNEGLKVKGVVD